MVSENRYFQVPAGTIFIFNKKYRLEIDENRYPSVISLSGDKFEQIMHAGNGNLLESNVEDSQIEQIFNLNKERKKKEETIKDKLRIMLAKITKEGFYKNREK